MSKEISEAIVEVARSLDSVAEGQIGGYNATKGDHGYTIADSLESIALTFNRYVELLEQQQKSNRIDRV